MNSGPRFPKMAMIVSGKYFVREKPIVCVIEPYADLKIRAFTCGPLTPSQTAFFRPTFCHTIIVMIAIEDLAKIIWKGYKFLFLSVALEFL